MFITLPSIRYGKGQACLVFEEGDASVANCICFSVGASSPRTLGLAWMDATFVAQSSVHQTPTLAESGQEDPL